MFYKYLYYKIYQWVRRRYGEDYPQFYVLNVIAIFLFLNVITILKIISYFKIINSSLIKYFFENTFIYLIVTVLLIYIFNVIYFFKINHWRKVLKYFENNKENKIDKILLYIYLLCTIGGFLIMIYFPRT